MVHVVPDPSTIAKRRHLLRTGVRAFALVLIVHSLLGANDVLAEYLTTEPDYAPYTGWDLVVREVLVHGVPIALAAILLVIERSLCRWLVPMPKVRCPGCEYTLDGTPPGRCPECGLMLDPAHFGGYAGVMPTPKRELQPNPISTTAASSTLTPDA